MSSTAVIAMLLHEAMGSSFQVEVTFAVGVGPSAPTAICATGLLSN